MNMTHYMELLAVNQPWNLISFMAIPIVLAETLAITELYILFTRKFDGNDDASKDRESEAMQVAGSLVKEMALRVAPTVWYATWVPSKESLMKIIFGSQQNEYF